MTLFKKWVLTALVCIFCLYIWSNTQACAAASEPKRFKLDNGLSVVIQENHATPLTAIQVWIKAGSTYENDEQAGITHFIEHMIFKGTEKYPPGTIASKVESLGGQINAFTSYDYTVYHILMRSDLLESAADILSNAISHPSFDPSEIEKEKPVVLEEIRMRKDRPAVRLFEEVMAQAYTGAPYKRPVIGYPETVSKLTRGDLFTYVQQHYVPSNVTVVVVGDVKTAPCLQLIRQKFSEIKGTDFQTYTFVESGVDHIRAKLIKDDIAQLRMAVCFPIPGFSDPDMPALDVLASVLGGGESSRLYRKMRVEKNLAHETSAMAFTPKGPGLFAVELGLRPEQSKKAFETALREIFRLKHEDIGPDELARAKLNIESEFIYSQEKVDGQARKLGYFEVMAGNYLEQRNYLKKISAITALDIREVASKYFQDKKLIAGVICPAKAEVDLSSTDIALSAQAAEKEAEALRQQGSHSASPVIKRVLPNGMTLLVKEDRNLPLVSLNAVFLGGLRAEAKEANGIFNAVAMLWKKGTKTKKAGEIASEIEGMAGKIEGFSGKNSFGLSASFLSRFFAQGFNLFGDLIINPTFQPEELDRMKPVLLAKLKEQEDNLIACTFINLNKSLFSGHPYALNPLGSEASINNISVGQIKDVYNRYACPKNLVLAVVGDVNASEVIKQAEEIFSAWKRNSNFEIKPGKPDPILSPKELIMVKARQQTHIAIAFPGTSLYDPDRPALDVLNNILSGQGGRLFLQLRDRESLAYSLSAFATQGIETGAFGVYMATRPEMQARAVKGLWRELDRVKSEQVSESELERSKNHIIGITQAELQSYGSQAMDMSINERYGLGYDFTEKYMQQIKKVTAGEVYEVARKYLDKGKHVFVKVGPESQTDGK